MNDTSGMQPRSPRSSVGTRAAQERCWDVVCLTLVVTQEIVALESLAPPMSHQLDRARKEPEAKAQPSALGCVQSISILVCDSRCDSDSKSKLSLANSLCLAPHETMPGGPRGHGARNEGCCARGPAYAGAMQAGTCAMVQRRRVTMMWPAMWPAMWPGTARQKRAMHAARARREL